ncbi:MAG: M56 family metallopeptidase [Anaerostipes sp.]
MREDFLVRVFSAVFFSMCTGSIFFVYWHFLSSKFVNKTNQKIYDFCIKPIVCLYFVPIIYFVITNIYDDGFTFSITPAIQKGIYYIAIIWASGTACMLLRFFKNVIQLRQEKNRCMPCKGWMIHALEECKATLGIKRKIRMYQGYRIQTPMITGLLCPCILLPMNDFSKEELHVYLYHELNHYKKHDIFWNYLSCIMVCIHWYFPPVRWVHQSVDQWSEICCDMMSIPYAESLKKYFTIILTMCEKRNQVKVYSAAYLFENRTLLEKRIKYAMEHFHTTRSKKYIVMLGTLCFIALSSVSVCAMTEGYHAAYLTLEKETSVEIEETGNANQQKKLDEKEELLRIKKKQQIIATQLTGDESIGIDYKMKADKCLLLENVKTKNNDKLDICIGGFKETDTVKVGIIDENQMVRYVQVTNEEQIWHTFFIKKAGTYKVFIENLNDNEMKLSGYIALLPEKES